MTPLDALLSPDAPMHLPLFIRRPTGHDWPRQEFFTLAAETPVVVLAGTVHFLVAGLPDAPDRFTLEGIRFALLPAQSLSEMEVGYMREHATRVETFKAVYLHTTVDQRIESLQAMRRKLDDLRAPLFIVNELIPRMHALEGEKPIAPQLPAPALPALPPAVPASTDTPRAIDVLVRSVGRYAMILDDRIFDLLPISPHSRSDLVVCYNNMNYGLSRYSRLLKMVEREYHAAFRQALQEQALAEIPERVQALHTLEVETRKLAPDVMAASPGGNQKLYRGREYSVQQSGGTWYACIEVPRYVVEDGGGTLYRFDATQIGVAIPGNPADAVGGGKAVVLTSYEHMFVSSESPFAPICMVKPTAYYQELRRLSPADAICAYLGDARRTLTSGHHAGNGSTPHHAIDSYSHRMISRADAERDGLPVFPYRRA